jgi:hypothetical protein
MPRLFPLYAVMATLATAAPLFAQGAVSPEAIKTGGHVFILVDRPLPLPGHFIWVPVQNVCSGESTLDLQYAATVQSQTAFLRVFLPDDTFGLSAPDPLRTVPIPDLTGWRKSLASLGEASHQQPGEVMIHGESSDFPFQAPAQKQVFNIAIGTEF